MTASRGINEALRHIRTLNAPATKPPTLLEAAKTAVALSGWQFRETPQGREKVFVSSALAIEVLKAAIEREENPTFALAPEPINPGVL